MRNILIVVILVVLAALGYRYFQSKPAKTDSVANISSVTNTTVDTPTDDTVTTIDFEDIAPSYVDLSSSNALDINSASPVVTTSNFSCDGRQHCSQMTSCAEATYFNNNCPSTRMDGNNDDVPCERQWC